MTPVGINLIGYASGNLGLGVVAREFARALMSNGHAVSIFDLDAGAGRSGVDLSLQRHFVASLDALPHSINLWIIGADEMGRYALQVCDSPHLRTRFNAAFLWWELPHIPAAWAVASEVFDALVTGSEFVRETWANAVPETPTLLARSPLQLPKGIGPDRGKFGLPEDAFLVYTGFEPASDPVRKNPFAAVQAFQIAFPSDREVRLVIKVNNPGASLAGQAYMARLLALAEADDRILLLRERLAYVDLLTLYASCDVIISLHRAEGLALMPLEAMRLGKAVVATGWSGNMTYMSHANAGLVAYRFIPTDESSSNYAPSRIGITSTWADPDVEHAAAWLRGFHTDPDLRTSYAEQAARDSADYNRSALRTDCAIELAALQAQRHMRPAKDYAALRRRVETARIEQRYAHLTGAHRLGAKIRLRLARQYHRHIGWRFAPPGRSTA